MKFAVRKVVALLLAMLMLVSSMASFAEGTVEYSDTVSSYTLNPDTDAADEAIQEVYDEYIAELKAMTSYADRYAWLYSAKNEPASDLGDYFYADFIAYYNEKEPTGDAMCVCAEPLVYGADGHTEGCRWNINNLVTVPGASASSGSASVSGELPAGATLSASSKSTPAAFTGLFEADKGAYTDTQYNSYDLKIMVGDQQWQPGSKVAVTLSNVWSGEGTPAVYVYHFIDVASAIDSDCIISYDSALVSAYPEAAAAANKTGYANAVAYEVLSTNDGTATYNAETNSVSFSLDSFSYVVTGASAEAYDAEMADTYQDILDEISNTEMYPTMDKVYVYFNDYKANMPGGLDAFYTFYEDFVLWYKSENPTGTMICTCTTREYNDDGTLSACPPYAYNTTDHEATCPWHSDNIGQTSTTLSAGNGISITGVLPANVYAESETISGLEGFENVFELDHIDYSDITVAGYDIKLLTADADGNETVWHPEDSVYVTIPDVLHADCTACTVYVVHFLDSVDAIKSGSGYEIYPYDDLDSMFQDAAAAAAEAGISGLAYELLSTENGGITRNYDNSIGFTVDSFSPFIVMSGTQTYEESLDDGDTLDVQIALNAESAIIPINYSRGVTTATSDNEYIKASGTTGRVTITLLAGVKVNDTATIKLTWGNSYTRTAYVYVKVVTYEEVFDDVTVTRGGSSYTFTDEDPAGTYNTKKVVNVATGLTVEIDTDGKITVSADSTASVGTYSVSWEDDVGNKFALLITVQAMNHLGNISVLAGESSSKSFADASAPAAGTEPVVTIAGTQVSGFAITGTADGTLTVAVADTVADGKYYAMYTGTDGEEYSLIVVVGATSAGAVSLDVGESVTKTVTSAPDSNGIVLVDSNGNPVTDKVTVTYKDTTLTVTAASDAAVGKYIAKYTGADGIKYELNIYVNGGNAADSEGEVVQQGRSTVREMPAGYECELRNANGDLVTDSSITFEYDDTNELRISASSSAVIGSYTVRYGNTDANGYFIPAGTFALDVVAATVTNGTTTYPLSMYYYNTETEVYWDEYYIVNNKAAVYPNEDRIESVTLNSKTVVNGNSNVENWTGGKTLEDYYGSSVKPYTGNSWNTSLTVQNAGATTETLVITPKPGYYVTKIVVGCTGSGYNIVTPYNCNTWNGGQAFTSEFSLGTSSSVSIELPSNAFGHASDSIDYFILIMVAPIPSPLYVEYDYGDILDIVGTTTETTAVFNDAEGWTNVTAGNYYGSYAGNHIDTQYTQYKYRYADGLSDNDKAADVNKWTHYANTVTDDAKELAAQAGYYFAGWKASYYTKCTEDATDESQSWNNVDYVFDEDTNYGSAYYGEGENVALSTNVRLVAQWKPLELYVTKTVDGLTDAYSNDEKEYTIELQKYNEDTSKWDVVKTCKISVTGNNTSEAKLNVYSPVTAGTYRVVETAGKEDRQLDSATDSKMFFVVDETNGELVYTTETIMDGLNTTGRILNVTNIYNEQKITNSTPTTSFLRVQKTFSGIPANKVPENFAITITDANGVNYILNVNDTANLSVSSDRLVYTWTVPGLNAGTYTVTESEEEVANYEVTTTGTGTVATAASKMVISNVVNVPVVNSETWNISADIIVAKVSATDAYFVWTKDVLSANQREVVLAAIGGKATVGNTSFFTGSDSITYRGRTTQYKDCTLTFSYPKQFSTMWYGKYDGITGDNNEISVSNAYEMTVTSFNVTKTVSGNVGDQSKSFKLKIEVTSGGTAFTDFVVKDKSGNVLTADAGYYTFKHGDNHVVENVPIGANVVVTEYQEDYTASVLVTHPDGYDILQKDPVITDTSVKKAVDNIAPGTVFAFTNTKNIIVDTGILLDSAPYVLLLVLVGAGIAFLIIRRRRRED